MARYRWGFRFKRFEGAEPEPGLPTVSLVATDLLAAEGGALTGVISVQRTDGPTDEVLDVHYAIGGTAVNGTDYNVGSPLSGVVQIAIGQNTAQIVVTPADDATFEGEESVSITIQPNAAYNIGSPSSLSVAIADDDTATITEEHPTLNFAGQTALDAYRTDLKATPWKVARFQEVVTAFLSTGSTWNVSGDNNALPGTMLFAAFLLQVRRPSDDLGVNWHGQTWQQMFDKVIAWAYTPAQSGGVWKDGRYAPQAIALTEIWDALHNDMSAQQQADFQLWNENCFNNPVQKFNGTSAEVWDNGATDEHWALVLSGLASDDRAERIDESFLWTMRCVDSNDEMPYGFGLGREFHEGVPSRQGVPWLLRAMQHTGGYSDAQTIDRFLRHLRDNWWIVMHAIIPHPTADVQTLYRVNDKFHQQDSFTQAHSKAKVGAVMLNALAFLPGKVDLNGAGLCDQAALANSEADYFGYLQGRWVERIKPNDATDTRKARMLNFAKIALSPTQFTQTAFAWRSWLIEWAVEYPVKTRAEAGIPLVRRFAPCDLDWFYVQSEDFTWTGGSSLWYIHRRWQASQYEGGTRRNGNLNAHRNGPLFISGGETGHGKNGTNATWLGTGTYCFVDYDLYPLFSVPNSNNDCVSGQRIITANGTYLETIKTFPSMDCGALTTWFATARAVTVTDDLTRSYNSTPIQNGALATNPRQIDSLIRKMVILRRNAVSGDDHEYVVFYDRIELLDTKYKPLFHIHTAPLPTIDGTETPLEPWSPDGIPPGGIAADSWTATGPTRWDYPGATHLLVDNTVEPDVTVQGTGKGKVTWLIGGNPAEPASTLVRRQSGLNAVSNFSSQMNGTPGINPFGGWQGKTEYAGEKGTDKRAYVGLGSVSVQPTNAVTSTRFLVTLELMDSVDSPYTPAQVTCDANSVAVRVSPGAIVVFKKENGTHTSGNVDVPAGVTLVVLASLPPGVTRTLTPTTLTITSPERTASAGDVDPGNAVANDEGSLEVVVNGVAGNLAWS